MTETYLSAIDKLCACVYVRVYSQVDVACDDSYTRSIRMFTVKWAILIGNFNASVTAAFCCVVCYSHTVTRAPLRERAA